MIETIVILGASGDLTSRFLIPAIMRLHQAGELPSDFRIVGLARNDWDDATFRRHLEVQMAATATFPIPASTRTAVLAGTAYRSVDVTDRVRLAEALARETRPIVVYLALPPSLLKTTIGTLAASGLPKRSKLVVEKPFETDLSSAAELNRLLHESFPEQDVFRLDHFLGKQTVQKVALSINNWRWAGVPFVLRTGKALGRNRREMRIHFKPVPHVAFGPETQPPHNMLTLDLAPDRIALSVNVNKPRDLFELDQVALDQSFGPAALPAYARLLLEVLKGDPTLSIRDDEAEESWRIEEPILARRGAGGVPMVEYPAGSQGPMRL